MMPSVKQLADAQNAINVQQPSLSGCRSAAEGGWVNEHDGNGMLIVRFTPEQLGTISMALGVASIVALEACKPTPVQLGWAAIIDAGLMARGSAGLASDSLRALERVDRATLERMAVLVLGETQPLAPGSDKVIALATRELPELVDAGCL
jgi:hypothetical protein